MPLRSVLFATVASLALSGAALAAPPADKCPPRPGFAMLSPEQRMMMFADVQAQADSAAIDPQIARQMQRDKLKAMSEDQRKAFFDNLTKRWNALPATQQAKIKADALKWRAEHPRPDFAGKGGPRGDCPPPPAH